MIPEHLRRAIDRYVEHGTPLGGFLTAVICNDLKGALGKADTVSRASLFDIVSYCYNEIPSDCWGSPEKMAAWMKERFKPFEEKNNADV